ncbi:glycosyltransferase, MGT family [Lentzea xinjiangensis]|uniref:Glycosyltransferase, MGT family n=1 Tax=Lentzea xinjiangensis TaxID=402600 RepID=A0A1H9LYZ6_9PSEU|nr:macrolide family glycosyltransferase [Lentzea xinjiangensis]SER16033.1 glycosyltransferase, MGT family [Lentzea xinjiangensis]
MGILFVTLAGHGHVTPTLAVVEELVRRGVEIDYATGSEHAAAVTAAGARWVELPALPEFRPVRPDPLGEWFRHYFAAMSATYPVLLDRCRTDRPDLICYDATNWPARLVARRLGIPAVRTLPHIASNEQHRVMDVDLNPHLSEDTARFAAEHGVEIDPWGTVEAPEACSVVFLPREFQPFGDTFDETFHFVGPVLGRRGDEEWSPRRTDLPLLYVSLGSVMSDPAFYRACAEQFGDGAWQVVMSARDAGEVPENFDVRPWFPQPAVLRHAAAFISHGGMNSVMEALQQGVPLVVVPLTPEQGENADRVAELGLGERVHDHADLRATVDRVASSDTIRRNVDRMRAAIENSGGAARAADVILSRAPRAA